MLSLGKLNKAFLNKTEESKLWNKKFLFDRRTTGKANGTFSSAFYSREAGKLSVTTSTDFAVENYENPQ